VLFAFRLGLGARVATSSDSIVSVSGSASPSSGRPRRQQRPAAVLQSVLPSELEGTHVPP
jgi:hypothetical protein